MSTKRITLAAFPSAHNSMVIIRDGQAELTPTVARLDRAEDAGATAYTRSTVLEYNGADWTRMAADAPWRVASGHAAVSHAGKLWLLGGYGEDVTSDVWTSDDGEQWSRVE